VSGNILKLKTHFDYYLALIGRLNQFFSCSSSFELEIIKKILKFSEFVSFDEWSLD
jgi:hypothetical protein